MGIERYCRALEAAGLWPSVVVPHAPRGTGTIATITHLALSCCAMIAQSNCHSRKAYRCGHLFDPHQPTLGSTVL